MRVLVTGASGFVGLHLIRLLNSRGHTIYGTAILGGRTERVPGARIFRCDIRDGARLRAIVRRVRPQRVYHLAAFSSVVNSFGDFRSVYETNFWGTFNVLEAVRQEAPKARVLVVGTGQCYGAALSSRLPVAESQPLSPQSPYALSKAVADMLAAQYHQRFGLHIIRARPFNHTGPGQASEFVCSDWARQIASAELRLTPPTLRVGDLTVQRDFSDVRDVVRAYELLLEKGKPGEAYNVGSGRATPMRQIAKLLTGFSSLPIQVRVQSRRLRPGEARALYGSIRKLTRDTGWKPKYNLESTLSDLYFYWKEQLLPERH
ncbi:MAG: GDP-mannose 4,6-dehydratase [Terriglobia bacterium]